MGRGASPALDLNWVDTLRNKKAQMKLEKLDNDLKNYKSNSNKESIRRGDDQRSLFDSGDLANALKCYSRARTTAPRASTWCPCAST